MDQAVAVGVASIDNFRMPQGILNPLEFSVLFQTLFMSTWSDQGQVQARASGRT
jgi:hypothetical protein